jgi:hypothetical protein
MKIKHCLSALVLSTLTLWHGGAAQAVIIDFEDLALASDSFENGSGLAGGFTSGGAHFNNYYDTLFDSWEGWAYSNQTDVTTPGYGNQYSAYHLPSGGGAGGSTNFAVAYTQPFELTDARITLPVGFNPVSAEVTNVTYAALVMRDGDPFFFSRKFGTPPAGTIGVPDGEWPDWFKLIITGLDENQQPLAAGPVEFYLADYRNIGGAPDYIVDHWTTVDLSPLAGARYLVFSHDSSDTGPFGVNTPTYVALDNLVLAPVPEPSTLALVVSGLIAAAVVGRRRFVRASRA